jgi:hypothetical protein
MYHEASLVMGQHWDRYHESRNGGEVVSHLCPLGNESSFRGQAKRTNLIV